MVRRRPASAQNGGPLGTRPGGSNVNDPRAALKRAQAHLGLFVQHSAAPSRVLWNDFFLFFSVKGKSSVQKKSNTNFDTNTSTS